MSLLGGLSLKGEGGSTPDHSVGNGSLYIY